MSCLLFSRECLYTSKNKLYIFEREILLLLPGKTDEPGVYFAGTQVESRNLSARPTGLTTILRLQRRAAWGAKRGWKSSQRKTRWRQARRVVLALAAIKCYNGVNYCRTTARGDSFVRVCPTKAMLDSSLRCPRFPSLQLYARRDCRNKRQLNERNGAESLDEIFFQDTLRLMQQCATFVILFIYIVYINTSLFSLTNERCFLFDLYAFLYTAINCVLFTYLPTFNIAFNFNV